LGFAMEPKRSNRSRFEFEIMPPKTFGYTRNSFHPSLLPLYEWRQSSYKFHFDLLCDGRDWTIPKLSENEKSTPLKPKTTWCWTNLFSLCCNLESLETPSHSTESQTATEKGEKVITEKYQITLSSTAVTLDPLELTPNIGSFVRSIKLPPRVLRIRATRPKQIQQSSSNNNKKEKLVEIEERPRSQNIKEQPSSPQSKKRQTPKIPPGEGDKNLNQSHQMARKDSISSSTSNLIKDLGVPESTRGVVLEDSRGPKDSWSLFGKREWELIRCS